MTPYRKLKIAQAKINSASTDKQREDAKREFDEALRKFIKAQPPNPQPRYR